MSSADANAKEHGLLGSLQFLIPGQVLQRGGRTKERSRNRYVSHGTRPTRGSKPQLAPAHVIRTHQIFRYGKRDKRKRKHTKKKELPRTYRELVGSDSIFSPREYAVSNLLSWGGLSSGSK